MTKKPILTLIACLILVGCSSSPSKNTMQLAMETFLAKNDVKMVGGEFATRNRTDYSGIIRIDDSKVTNHYKKKMGGKTVIFYEFDAQYTVVIGEISKARFRLS